MRAGRLAPCPLAVGRGPFGCFGGDQSLGRQSLHAGPFGGRLGRGMVGRSRGFTGRCKAILRGVDARLRLGAAARIERRCGNGVEDDECLPGLDWITRLQEQSSGDGRNGSGDDVAVAKPGAAFGIDAFHDRAAIDAGTVHQPGRRPEQGRDQGKDQGGEQDVPDDPGASAGIHCLAHSFVFSTDTISSRSRRRRTSQPERIVAASTTRPANAKPDGETASGTRYSSERKLRTSSAVIP